MSPSTDSQHDQRYRVLVVDADTAMARALEAALRAEMDVVTCGSGSWALRNLALRSFDVVCVDYHLPDMDGSQFLRAAEEAQPEASCLLVTAASDAVPPDARRRHYLVTKPFDTERPVRLVAHSAASLR
ncbi:MAG: response regulator [Polyangiaceae bacterium]